MIFKNIFVEKLAKKTGVLPELQLGSVTMPQPVQIRKTVKFLIRTR
jgi:hypothetical protein